MDNKTIGATNKDRGHLLQNSDKDAFLIEKESIKIPFVNYNERKLPQKSYVISLQQPPYHYQLKRRKKQLLTRLKVNQKINQQTVFVYGKSFSNKKRSNQLASFFKTKSISPIKKQTTKIHQHPLLMSTSIEKSKQCPESEDQESQLLNIKSYKQNSLLPNIGLNKLRQRNGQKLEKKKKRKDKSNVKTQKSRNQMVKKCYSVELSKMNDVLPTAKRLKTQQEMQNQFILKKIVRAKPSADLSRIRLKDRYQKFEEYKLIRQRKSPIFSPKSFLLGRSSTINKSDGKKYIKI